MTGTAAKLITGLATAAAVTVLAAAPAAATPAAPMPTFNYGSSGQGVLLAPEDLDSIMSADGMEVRGESSELVEATMQPAECAGAFQPGMQEAFNGTTPEDVKIQSVADGEPGDNTVLVIQSAVTLSSKVATKQHLRDTVANWKQCAGETITFAKGTEWKLGSPEFRHDDTVMAITEKSDGATCEHAVAGYSEVFIDVMACDFNGGTAQGLAEDIAVAISENVASQKS